MPLVQFPRCAPTLLQLEDRCTPAQLITVFDKGWNPATKGTLPWAIALANSPAYPGQDIIDFDFSPAPNGLGPKPTINALSTVDVTEGVSIIGTNGNANDYVTIDGKRPFEFTHATPAPVEPGGTPATESVIDRVVFSKCAPPAAPANQSGGAIRVTGGTVTLQTARFVENTADNGGAVFVGTHGKLVVDGIVAGPPDFVGQNQPRTLFALNKATTDGGAIENQGTLVLKRGWFNQNEAMNGGGIDVYRAGVVTAPMLPADDGLMIPDVQFNGNIAGVYGGGMYYNSGEHSKLNGVVFWANEVTGAGGAGGGGLAVGRGTVSLTGGVVVGNKADLGQGVHIKADVGVASATVNATGVSFGANVDLLGKAGVPVLIDDGGVLNTSGCAFTGWGLPFIVPGSTGVWNTDPLNPDTP